MTLWPFWAMIVISGFIVLIFLNMRMSYQIVRMQEDVSFILALLNTLAGNWGSDDSMLRMALEAVIRAYPRRTPLPPGYTQRGPTP